MKTNHRVNSLAFGAIVLLQFLGCGTASPAGAPQDQPSANDGINRCALLTDDEVTTALGPHKPGINDIGNVWGLQSCRWTSTLPPKSKAPEGWFDSVEVTDLRRSPAQKLRGKLATVSIRSNMGIMFSETIGRTLFSSSTRSSPADGPPNRSAAALSALSRFPAIPMDRPISVRSAKAERARAAERTRTR
jgi:hypothetical protein